MTVHTALTVPQDTPVDTCWNRIGIYGSKDCPELAALSHCRNCPVFSRGAARLLDRALPGEANPDPLPPQAEPGEPTQSLMLFRLGAEWFALPTLALDEIVGGCPIHSLPHRRDAALLGLVNVRGDLVVCVSLARLLPGGGADPALAEQGQGWLMVARHVSGRFAFPVDEVAQTIERAPGARRPVPATLALSAGAFTRGLVTWRDRDVGWLDEAALFAAFDKALA
jgi:chemotaxis-related protein WspD